MPNKTCIGKEAHNCTQLLKWQHCLNDRKSATVLLSPKRIRNCIVFLFGKGTVMIYSSGNVYIYTQGSNINYGSILSHSKRGELKKIR